MKSLHTLLALLALTTLLLTTGCPLPTNCNDLLYDEATNKCVCPPGTSPNYELQICEGADGVALPWGDLDVPYLPMDAGRRMDSGLGDVGLVMPDGGPDMMPTPDAGPDAGPPPPDAQARYPWNGFATGSVHVPEGATVVNHPLRPKFMWEDVAGASHHQIQLTRECRIEGFRDCAFARPELDTTTTESIFRPETSLTVSRIQPVGSRYYWRVRACAGESCSDWTEVRYVDVGRDDHDFNGDGYADLVVTKRGRGVYVFYGSEGGITVAEPSVIVPPERSADRFGYALALGDTNADGYSDLLATAPDQSWPESQEGGAYLFTGTSGGLATEAVLAIDNPLDRGGADFGTSAAIGDIDADGYADVLIGASLHAGDVEDEEGNVYIYLGTPTGPAAEPEHSLDNPLDDSANFGHELAILGDIDGDGTLNFGVVAFNTPALYVYSGHTPTIPTLSISARLYRLSSGGDVDGDGFSDFVTTETTPMYYRGGLDGLASVAVTDAIPEAQARRTVCEVVGDVNGDGYADFLIATVGTASLHSGGLDASLLSTDLNNPSLDSSFGVAADGADYNGDGYSDVAIGTRYLDGVFNNEGAVDVFYGTPAGITITAGTHIPNPDPSDGDFFGGLRVQE